MKKELGTHERVIREETIQGSSDRSFGLVFAAVFLIIGCWPLTTGGGIRIWALIVAATFLAVALAYAKALAPLNLVWTKFGILLHKVVNPLIMALLFFLIVTPMGLVIRIMRKDLLHLRLEPAARSYWIQRQPPGPKPETMKNQF